MAKRIILLLLVLTSLATIYALVASSDRQFDVVAWREAKFSQVSDGHDIDHEYTLRYQMVNDLVTTKLSLGATSRDRIRELLGDPEGADGSPYSISVGRYDAYIIRYRYNIIDYDTEYLILRYDVDDKLKSIQRKTVQG